MSFWKSLKGELIDIIEWIDDSHDTLVYRFERYANEIKNGAKLIVRPGQRAIFVNEGRVADIFSEGTYELTTRNLPILSTLLGWKYGFDSPFKAEVYFISTRQFTNLKWGTKNPIMLRDQEFGVVRLRAFGTYAMRAADPKTLLEQIVGTNGVFTVAGIQDQIRNLVVSKFADALGEANIPALDLAANYDELGELIRKALVNSFASYGIEIPTLLVENISLPEEVERALDKRTSMGVVGNLDSYTKFQAAQAMEKAAENPSGDASAGMGMGMGFAMANQMAQSMNPQHGQPPPPPPPPAVPSFHVSIAGATSGPFTVQQLQGQAAEGKLTASTVVWTHGMSGWLPAGQVPALQGLFPPPPPPV